MTTLPLIGRRVSMVPTTPVLTPPDGVQQLWFATQVRHWQTLAILASDPLDAITALATSLVTVGRLTHTGEVDLLNTQGAGLREVSWHLLAMSQATARGAKLVVASDPVVTNPVSLPLVRAADAFVLVLTLGRSRLASARRTVELIGREHLAGSVLLDARALS